MRTFALALRVGLLPSNLPLEDLLRVLDCLALLWSNMRFWRALDCLSEL